MYVARPVDKDSRYIANRHELTQALRAQPNVLFPSNLWVYGFMGWAVYFMGFHGLLWVDKDSRYIANRRELTQALKAQPSVIFSFMGLYGLFILWVVYFVGWVGFRFGPFRFPFLLAVLLFCFVVVC